MYTLLDGILQNQMFPTTYQIPSEEEKAKLKIGDHVKLSFHEDGKAERMWVKIFVINGNGFQGQLDNEPTFIKSIMLEDIVIFESKNIIGIL